MSKRERMRYLKKVVLYCLVFSSLVVAAGLFVCWRRGFDPSGIVSAALMFFGSELLLSCLTKILENPKGAKKNADQLEAEADQP